MTPGPARSGRRSSTPTRPAGPTRSSSTSSARASTRSSRLAPSDDHRPHDDRRLHAARRRARIRTGPRSEPTRSSRSRSTARTRASTWNAILHFMPTADGSTVRGLVLNRAASTPPASSLAGTDGVVIEGNFIGTNPAGNRGARERLCRNPPEHRAGQRDDRRHDAGRPESHLGEHFQRHQLRAGRRGGGGGTSHLVQGNLIGTDASGGNAVPGQEKGIETLGVTSNILIGGTTAATVTSSPATRSTASVFAARERGMLRAATTVGTNPAGDAPVPNRSHGIAVEARTPRRRHGRGRGQPRFRQRA